MIITKTKTVTEEVIDHIICDNCGKKITPDDYIEWQEKLYIRFTGGYGSIFGDGTTMEAQLCQDCIDSVLGTVLRVEGDKQ